ncbi:MAG: autotransporter outer membrane beta-barrel domain-containing protein [Saprospiraceae bacterium]|nr:autotransporter outer membrane beta-barrel domain-containing protein [Saprospiraceae bacterium]
MRQLFTMLLVITNLFLYSQDQVKNWIVGGALGYDHSTVDGLKADPGSFNNGVKTASDEILFQPYFGKALNTRWIAGFITRYSLRTSNSDFYEDNRTSKSTTHNGGLGVFARYLVNPDHKLAFYIEPSVLAELAETKLKERGDVTGTINTASFAINVTPVVTYPLSDSFHFVGKFNPVGFEFGSFKTDDQSGKTKFSDFNGILTLNGIQVGVECRL